MPEFVNCKHCKKLFAKFTHSSYCENCAEAAEAVFRKVRDFLYAHPNSDALTVSRATGVSPDKIFEYVREGRVAVVPQSELNLKERGGDD
ncbi:MAG: hypothetical protein FWB98_00680 [Defluviitaleaceae bacterium]|nr:hypothetical protein [Defluviitaleaceae bacterium]